MESILKENLIEIVRKYECLYNTKHKEYKNKSYKLLLWERIGTMLEIDGNKAKAMWRTLRDGYIRYKKQIAGKTGSGRKYYKYTWSAQLAFLDGTLELRPTSSNITPQEAGTESSEIRISQHTTTTPSSPNPGPSFIEFIPPSPRTPLNEFPTYHNIPSSAETPPSGTPLFISAPRSSGKKKTTNISSEERTDKILDYLKNKKRHELDEVDHLFASYAKSFKKLSRRTQAELKINLAKLFSEAEIAEIDNRENQINELVYLSPAYPIVSEDSSQHSIILGQVSDVVQQPIIAMDLSQPGQSTTQDLSSTTGTQDEPIEFISENVEY